MVRWLVESETVHREDKELYEYAVYSLFLTVTPIVLILIIGSLLGKTIQGLIIIFHLCSFESLVGEFMPRN